MREAGDKKGKNACKSTNQNGNSISEQRTKQTQKEGIRSKLKRRDKGEDISRYTGNIDRDTGHEHVERRGGTK